MVENEVARLISTAINRLGRWEEEAAKELANEHPTLQQTFMRLCLYFIKAEAEKDLSRQDLRNEATVKVCKKIAEALPYEDFYVPMV